MNDNKLTPKQTRSKIIVVGVIALLTLGAILQLTQKHSASFQIISSNKESRTLSLLIASNWFKKFRGLSEISSLKNADGMIFLYNREKKHQFIMRNMRFNLDFFFIDKSGYVIEIKRNISRSYKGIITNKNPALMVLEVPSLNPIAQSIKIKSQVLAVQN